MSKVIYTAFWCDEGDIPYQLKSSDCKPQNECGDSEWWFDKETEYFYRYWTYHDERDGLQTVYEEVRGTKLS
jgi:hypothetical protein